MTEQFFLSFSKRGRPQLTCCEYDSTTGMYRVVPIPIGSERETRAMQSAAYAAMRVLRKQHATPVIVIDSEGASSGVLYDDGHGDVVEKF